MSPQWLLSSEQWDHIFASYQPLLPHSGGIYAALSSTSWQNLLGAVQAAKRLGTLVSYDFTYRPSLWAAQGAIEQMRARITEILGYVDILIGGEHDLIQSLGLDTPEPDPQDLLSPESFRQAAEHARAQFPRLQALVSTRRRVHSVNRHDVSAISWTATEDLICSEVREDIGVYDRVGAGDAFATGWLDAFLKELPGRDCVEQGVACGILAMSTPGDGLIASATEVKNLMAGGSLGIQR